MFRPVRMCRLDCMIMDNKKDNTVRALHERGITQLEFLDDSYLKEKSVERDRPLERVTEISSLLLRTRKVIDTLSRFVVVEQKNLVEDMLGVDRNEKLSVDDMTYPELVKFAEKLLSVGEDKVEEYGKETSELSLRKSGLQEKLKSYRRFTALGFRLEHVQDSDYVSIFVGQVQEKSCLPLKEKLKAQLGNKFAMAEGALAEGKRAICISVMQNKKEDVEKTLREAGFEHVQFSGEGNIKDVVSKMESELKAIESREKAMDDDLRKIYDRHYLEFMGAEEMLKLEKDRCEIPMSFGRTGKVSLLRMWVPRDKYGEVEKLINSETGNRCFIEADLNPDDAPIILDNPRPFNYFEPLTRLFSLPKYNEIDPTIIMAPTFCIFFGIMLTDAIYGAFLIAAGIAIYSMFGKYSDNAKSAGVIMSGCGIAAIAFGVLTGSYFGGFIPQIVFDSTSQNLALWMDPMYGSNAIQFLVVMCVIGFIHIFSGYLIGAIESFKHGKPKEALTHYLSWYILMIGGVLAALSQPVLGSLLPETFMYIGGGLVGVGVILLLVGKGFMTFIEMIGLVGSTLSYARLLAMAMTTAGIAMSFNVLASMAAGIPYIGIVIAAIVFLFGHTINILISSLGAFVHSIRLHYVEHFGTYYAGGGKEFKPFKEERVYTCLK